MRTVKSIYRVVYDRYLLPAVRFLSYVKRIIAVSDVDLGDSCKTVQDAINEIARRFPSIQDLIQNDVPEVSFILGEKSLLVPKDLSLPFDKDLIIGPIVAGG